MAGTRVTEADIEKIIADARAQVDRDIFFEPRAHFDTIVVGPTSSSLVSKTSAPDSLMNGEQFPHHITHVVFSGLPPDTAPVATPERPLQRIGARLLWHDVDYPNRDGTPLPCWQTQPSSLIPSLAQGCSVWRFAHPVVLSARDSLKVTVRAITDPAGAPDDAITVAVAFHGVGVYSRRPYMLHSEIDLLTTHPTDLDAVDFRNDNSEPIALYDLVAQVTIPGTTPILGDTRRVTLNVKQTGAGTSAQWFDAIASAPAVGRPIFGQIPISLLGVDGGRAIVHRLPGEGIVLLPGDGMQVIASDLGLTTDTTMLLYVGLLGYVVVK